MAAASAECVFSGGSRFLERYHPGLPDLEAACREMASAGGDLRFYTCRESGGAVPYYQDHRV